MSKTVPLNLTTDGLPSWVLVRQTTAYLVADDRIVDVVDSRKRRRRRGSWGSGAASPLPIH